MANRRVSQRSDMHSILVATDGSEDAHAAVRRAIDLAAESEATLYVLAVIDRRVHGEPGLSSEELVTIETEDRYSETVEEVRRQADAAGVDCRCEVCHGVPHERILELADEIDADVIIVGTHGDHGTHLGEVGQAVLQSSPRDVEFVGPPSATATADREH